MSVRFTARHMEGGSEHKHIAELKWVEDGAQKTGVSARAVLVEWIRDKQGSGYVLDSKGNKAVVKVRDAKPPYVQTIADGKWTDNLLALPTF